jgi:hypothetical protein
MSDSEIAKGRVAGAVVVQFVNAMIIVASPRVSAKLQKEVLHDYVLAQLSAFLEALEQMRPNRANAAYDDTMFYMEPHALALKERAALWAPREDIPPDIVALARACLQAYGAPEPPEGWDRFEG